MSFLNFSGNENRASCGNMAISLNTSFLFGFETNESFWTCYMDAVYIPAMLYSERIVVIIHQDG